MCKKTAPPSPPTVSASGKKVLHCPATGKYVMYIHAETPDYGYAHIGVAVADAPTGFSSHSDHHHVARLPEP